MSSSSRSSLSLFAFTFLAIGGFVLFLARIGRGRKVTRTKLNEDDYVAVKPKELAGSAFLHVDVYSLARCIASEHPLGNLWEKSVIGAAILNEAEFRGVTVTKLLIRRSYKGRLLTGNGFYGKQAGRHASTALDPRELDVSVATNILNGFFPDPTGGARRFLHANQDQYTRAKVKGYNKTFAEVVEKWGKEGWVPLKVPNVPGWTFFRKAA